MQTPTFLMAMRLPKGAGAFPFHDPKVRMALGCIALLTSTVPQPANAAAETVPGPKLKWSMSWWGKSRPATAGSEYLARRIAERTAGNWTLAIHWDAKLSKPDRNLENLAAGKFEAAAFCNFFHPRKNPALMALSMPFLPIAGWENNRKVRDAAYEHPAISQEFRRRDVRLYVSTYLPAYEFMGTGSPPLQVTDWQNRTIRAGGGLARAMMVLDAKPSDAGPAALLQALRDGSLNAVSLPFTYGHAGFGIPSVAKWFTANLTPGTFDCPLAFSAKAYAKLPRQYRALLDELRAEVAEAQISAYREADHRNLAAFRRTMTEIRYGREQLLAYRRIAGRPVIEEWISANQGSFDARGLIERLFAAAGETYE